MTAATRTSHRKLIDALTEHGERVIGTSAAGHAAKLIRTELEAAGYAVAEHEFKLPAWAPAGAARLEVTAPEQVAMESQPMLWSGGSPTGGARGRLVPLGHTRLWEGSYSWPKFAVVDCGALAGYILVHDGGRAIVQPCPPGSDRTLPHLVVGQEDGERLARWLREDQAVTVLMEAPVQAGGERQGVNLVTTLGERGVEARQPLVCAHYDTVFNTPGAYDNATGVVAVLELARRLAAPERPVPRFAFFCGEEWHLAGSRAFVAGLGEEERAAIPFVLNIDGIGRGTRLDVGVGPEWFEWTVHDAIREHLGDTAVQVQTTFPPLLGSDHAPFYEAGIPALHLTVNDWDLLHRPEDEPASVNGGNVSLVIDLAERLIGSLTAEQTNESTSVTAS